MAEASMSFVTMIMSAGNSLTNGPAEHPAVRRSRAGWEARLLARDLEQPQARLSEAEAVLRSAREPVCWRAAWREQIRPGPRDPSVSGAMTWAIRNACMPKAIVYRFPARSNTVRPLLTPPPLLYLHLRPAGRKPCLQAYRHRLQAFHHRRHPSDVSATAAALSFGEPAVSGQATSVKFALMRL
jgi:hypothetical protein